MSGTKTDTSEEVIEKDGNEAEDKAEEKEEDNKEEVKPDPLEAEPEKRKSSKDYIIERKDDKIEKLENEIKDGAEDDVDDARIGNIVKKQVAEALDPFKKQLEGNTNLSKDSLDEAEINELYAKSPEAREFDKPIRKYAEAFPTVPYKDIWFLVAAKSGKFKQMEQDADNEANMSRTGGGAKPIEEKKAPDYKNMSDADFDKLDEEEGRKGQSN